MTDLNRSTGAGAPTSDIRRAREPRSRVHVWVVGIVVALVLVIAYFATFLLATVAFDSAFRVHSDSAAAAHIAVTQLSEQVQGSTAIAAASDDIVALATDELVTSDAREGFALATTAFAEALDAGEALDAEAADTDPVRRPEWPWELWTASMRMNSAAVELDRHADVVRAATNALSSARVDLTTAADALFDSVLVATKDLEAAHVNALGWIMVDFRLVREAVADQELLGRGAATAFETYAQRVADVKRSDAEELAEKAGPLLEKRLTVEAYARSISGGVSLDFDWAPQVNGIGGAAGISGTSSWNPRGNGFSTITLSDSVAELWPDPAAVGLVTHEVGHSISAKCEDLYDPVDQAAIEAWATAWAISMGHSPENSGADLYGEPPAELIATAATCR